MQRVSDVPRRRSHRLAATYLNFFNYNKAFLLDCVRRIMFSEYMYVYFSVFLYSLNGLIDFNKIMSIIRLHCGSEFAIKFLYSSQGRVFWVFLNQINALQNCRS